MLFILDTIISSMYSILFDDCIIYTSNVCFVCTGQNFLKQPQSVISITDGAQCVQSYTN
jgi:hypothetical protein